MAIKIKIDQETCIGCGACAAVCDNFEIGDDGKAHVKSAEVKKIGCNQQAADGCPVQCIKLTQ